MSAKIISIINYKGGVGKTTTTYNLAVAMAYLSGKRVLLVDLDPQCSLSTICLKSYAKKVKEPITLKDLDNHRTLNHIIKQYLLEAKLRIPTRINKSDVIFSEFYIGSDGQILEGLDFIPTTMFDYSEGEYPEGLDNLEIRIIAQSSGSGMEISRNTIFAKFFKDYDIVDDYDFILFDCPPANSIMTQNALAVSDYYIIPTIMDELSTNGILHLKYIIQTTIYKQLFKDMMQAKEAVKDDSYFSLIKDRSPKLLGIFETLRKSSTKTDKYREAMNQLDDEGDLVFKAELKHLKKVGEAISEGLSVFSIKDTSIKRSDKEMYTLLYEIYGRMGVNQDCIDKQLINRYL
jgi:cellulose biosynthesis protein BcsQ